MGIQEQFDAAVKIVQALPKEGRILIYYFYFFNLIYKYLHIGTTTV